MDCWCDAFFHLFWCLNLISPAPAETFLNSVFAFSGRRRKTRRASRVESWEAKAQFPFGSVNELSEYLHKIKCCPTSVFSWVGKSEGPARKAWWGGLQVRWLTHTNTHTRGHKGNGKAAHNTNKKLKKEKPRPHSHSPCRSPTWSFFSSAAFCVEIIIKLEISFLFSLWKKKKKKMEKKIRKNGQWLDRDVGQPRQPGGGALGNRSQRDRKQASATGDISNNNCKCLLSYMRAAGGGGVESTLPKKNRERRILILFDTYINFLKTR